MGKSRLRKPEQPALDAKYGGVAVSRSALNGEDDEHDPFAPVDESGEDDPFAARNRSASGSEDEEGSDASDDVEGIPDGDESEEIDSDEALGESDAEKFKKFTFRGSKKNRIAAPSQDEAVSSGEDDSENSEDITDGSDTDMDDASEDGSDDGSSVSSATRSSPPPALRSSKASHNPEREELKRLAFSSSSTAGLASALSAGANADAQKGRAVKHQRQTFDRLLDARIKLQKGVAAANDLAVLTDEQVQTAAKQAEDAALALWSTIDSIRCTLLSASTAEASKTDSSSLKRKRRLQPLKATPATPLTEIWEHSNLLEEAVQSTRRQTLDKWHAKTQPVLDTAPRSKLLPSKPSSSHATSRLTDVLDTYLTTESAKLIAQSWSPATSTKANNNNTPQPASQTSGGAAAGIYDDSVFYQALLRDLIASRSANANATTADGGPILLPPKLHPSGSRHKKVDTKASKGRKVRYTVHEKLENFMAPEDRATWEDAARSEFFASLFGNAAAKVLNEDEGEEEHGLGEDATGEAEALRLFRN